ncbi:MAG: PRC-barrel domain-containing protein [Desulfatiglandaceae bacterium]
MMSGWIHKSLMVFGALLILSFGASGNVQAVEGESLIMASKIMDGDVYDKKDNLIGEVDDMILRRSGTVKKLTIEFGGFFDIGDKLVSLNFKSFSFKNGDIALEMTEERLNKKEAFDYYEANLRPDYYYRYWRQPGPPYAGPPSYRPHAFYYSPYTPDYGREYGPAYRPGRRGRDDESYIQQWAYSPSRFLASVAFNRRLVDEGGEDLGRVQDFVIDTEKKEISKIVISSVDIGGDEVHIALPYQPLGFTGYGLVYQDVPGKLRDFIYPYEE